MFSISSQCEHWMFADESELESLRTEANSRFISQHLQEYKGPKERLQDHFLTAKEEKSLSRQYEVVLKDFCRKFQPPMNRSVVGTAFQYLKRFYLNNSVMDYHPKHIVVTCVYLACKVEEFNVSMAQFVANIKGDREKAADVVLNNELLLMQQLKYHLTVHNPFRPVEGLLIDIKTRCLTAGDPERFRPHIEIFLEKTHFTDACLLYSPSQIALAAIVYAASICDVDLDSYLTDILLDEATDKLNNLREMMTSLWKMINDVETPAKDQVKAIEKKLEKCRNQANNPDSQEYKRALQDSLNEEEGQPLKKYAKLTEEQKRRDDALLEQGISQLSSQ